MRTDKTPSGRVITFEVEENPVVRQVTVTGNENIDSDKIRDTLTLTTGSTLDYPLLFENRERIEALYRAAGLLPGARHATRSSRSAGDAVVGRLRGERGREAPPRREI